MSHRVLIVIDIQKEVETKGRPYCIDNLQDSLGNAKKVLLHARKNGWTIYHMQHLQDGDIFGYNSPLSEFIEGFEPLAGEELFTKGNYSCFSSPDFTEALKKQISNEIVIVGYGTTKCVLSTIIDGYHRGYKMTLVTDAAGAQPASMADSATMHKYSSQILSAFSQPVTTAQLTT